VCIGLLQHAINKKYNWHVKIKTFIYAFRDLFFRIRQTSKFRAPNMVYRNRKAYAIVKLIQIKKYYFYTSWKKLPLKLQLHGTNYFRLFIELFITSSIGFTIPSQISIAKIVQSFKSIKITTTTFTHHFRLCALCPCVAKKKLNSFSTLIIKTIQTVKFITEKQL
jgi:hypothetical protein